MGANAARHRHRRQPGQVERRRRANERLLHRFRPAGELVLELVAALGRGRDSWRQERVELLRLEDGGDRLLHQAAHALSAQVEGRRQQQAGLEERAHLLVDGLRRAK